MPKESEVSAGFQYSNIEGRTIVWNSEGLFVDGVPLEQAILSNANKLNFKHNARYLVIDLGEPDGEEKAITTHCGYQRAYTTDSVDGKINKNAWMKGIRS